jgi:glycosyltransferase involved in cell wall biosynthesis
MSAPWLLVAGDFSRTGGMDRANYQLAWYLADRLGRAVHLVAHRVAAPLANHPGVRVHLAKRPLASHALGGPVLDWVGRRLARHLRAADLRTHVVVNGGNCLWPGAINWVHMVQHACRPADAGAPWVFRLKNRLTRTLERRRERHALANSPLVLANSEKTRRELVELVGVPPHRVRVVYLGTDAEFTPPTPRDRRSARAALGLPDNAVVVLFVGALGYDRNKGFDTLLRAWQCWQKSGGPPGVLLAAGGGRLHFWRRMMDSLGLTASVRFAGGGQGIAPLMAAADLFVSPTRYDAYGLAVHEALCCGVPAIVSRAAGVAERYPSELQALILPDAEDAADLARRMRDCWERREHYRGLVAPFAENLRERTWVHVAADIVTLAEGAEAESPVAPLCTPEIPR